MTTKKKDYADAAKEGNPPKFESYFSEADRVHPDPPEEQNDKPTEPKRVVLTPLGAYLMSALNTAARRMKGDEKPIPLPWPAMAAQLGGGLWPGLHVLVSGTGVGKTQWVLQAAVCAAQAGFPVAYIGLELSAEAVAMRTLGQRAGFPWSRLFTGEATDENIRGAVAAAAELNPLPIYIEQRDPMGWAATNLEPLAKAVHDAHAKPSVADTHDPKVPSVPVPMLIVLDFLQLVSADPSNPRMDLRERIGRAAYAGQAVAQRYNAAVLMISSTARGSYEKVGGDVKEAGLSIVAPGMSEERRIIRNPDALIGLGKESGEIEYACDSVTAGIRLPSDSATERTIVFATAKVRAGVPGWSALRFDGNVFTDIRDHNEVLRRIEDPDYRSTGNKSAPQRQRIHEPRTEDIPV
jgi:replicative DNA helicase